MFGLWINDLDEVFYAPLSPLHGDKLYVVLLGKLEGSLVGAWSPVIPPPDGWKSLQIFHNVKVPACIPRLAVSGSAWLCERAVSCVTEG